MHVAKEVNIGKVAFTGSGPILTEEMLKKGEHQVKTRKKSKYHLENDFKLVSLTDNCQLHRPWFVCCNCCEDVAHLCYKTLLHIGNMILIL